MIKKEIEQSKTGTVVPQHKELKIGTLKAILEQAKVREEEFSEYLRCEIIKKLFYFLTYLNNIVPSRSFLQ